MAENQSQSISVSRVTENKRRYRARRKEYVSDLERRLAEAREQGVQATKEVQLSAQKVVLQNARLRELLRLASFSDGDIDAWLEADGKCDNGVKDANHARRQACAQKAREYAVSRSAGQVPPRSCISAGSAVPSSRSLEPNQPFDTDRCIVSDYPSSLVTRPSLGQDQSLAMPPATEKSRAASVEVDTNVGPPFASPGPRQEQKVPCRLLSRLAENPGTDLSQVPVPPAPIEVPTNGGGGTEGFECGKAYEMLIRFGTSDEKMDEIAHALETGCTPDGKGWCSVKKKVIWQVLDGMCG